MGYSKMIRLLTLLALVAGIYTAHLPAPSSTSRLNIAAEPPRSNTNEIVWTAGQHA